MRRGRRDPDGGRVEQRDAMAGRTVNSGDGRAGTHPLSILQINADRSVAAHDMAHTAAVELTVDIIIASEPNKRTAKNAKWMCDTNVDVACYIRNQNIRVW